jgi:anionic cell wall polymer biosynthesis LytR-Cps2A-Psr (LCP) family protein
MATVVGVLDRPGWRARTDNIVVADPAERTLLWIPRDLWCEGTHQRINTAFARGGHRLLRSSLAEHGISVQYGVCVQREAVESALADAAVAIPVRERMEFWYPLAPQRRIEEGRRLIAFEPPGEVLSGERIHQWLGARSSPDRPRTDLDRIERQQVFLSSLLHDGFDFTRVLATPELVSISGDAALAELRQVDASWRSTIPAGLHGLTVDGRQVLALGSRPNRIWRAFLRARTVGGALLVAQAGRAIRRTRARMGRGAAAGPARR